MCTCVCSVFSGCSSFPCLFAAVCCSARLWCWASYWMQVGKPFFPLKVSQIGHPHSSAPRSSEASSQECVDGQSMVKWDDPNSACPSSHTHPGHFHPLSLPPQPPLLPALPFVCGSGRKQAQCWSVCAHHWSDLPLWTCWLWGRWRLQLWHFASQKFVHPSSSCKTPENLLPFPIPLSHPPLPSVHLPHLLSPHGPACPWLHLEPGCCPGGGHYCCGCPAPQSQSQPLSPVTLLSL